MDWSSKNIICVALNNDVYIWDPVKKLPKLIVSLSKNQFKNLDYSLIYNDSALLYVSSVKWFDDGNLLAIGTSNNRIIIWDSIAEKSISMINGHDSRVASLAWNKCIISSGSYDGRILNHDIRMINCTPISTYLMHESEVCGLKWSANGRYLCSGSSNFSFGEHFIMKINFYFIYLNKDDSKVLLWDMLAQSQKPVLIMNEHKSAVKAIDWCPWQSNIVATGGGVKDRTLKIWNMYNGALLKNYEYDSQITGILWSDKDREILTSYGDDQGYFSVLKYPSMIEVGKILAHSGRILNINASPDGKTVVSLSADQTLRFWELFKLEAEKDDFGRSPISTRLKTQSLIIR